MMTVMASSLSCCLTSTPTSKPTGLNPSKPHQAPSCTNASAADNTAAIRCSRSTGRREAALSLATAAGMLACSSVAAAMAAEDEEYVRETSQVISKVRSTINMDRKDPNVATAVAELREASNSWVAKYRREKALLGRASFRDVYSALNAVSGHYISFGPTAPIPAKRRARILEEVDTAEKALLRGR